jgi:hypothetical protein
VFNDLVPSCAFEECLGVRLGKLAF